MAKKTRSKPGKLGRNDPCFCGSGLKYKKCCLTKGLSPPKPIEDVPQEVLAKWHEMNRKRAELHDKGIYIDLPNTISHMGKSFLAVGGKIMWDSNEHATFHQLILRNLSFTLGEEWWATESAKPEKERHFVKHCFEEISNKPIRDDQDLRQVTENLSTFLPTGHMLSLMSLAFDVWLLTHKGFMSDEWLQRLRSLKEYQGVRYEIAVASIFVRMGCRLEFYNDEGVKPRPMRPEFVAVHDQTNNRVAVEAKSRQRPGVIHSKGEQNFSNAMRGNVTRLFNRALKKQPGELPYLIFIDVNAPTETNQKTLDTVWFADIKKMIQAQGDYTSENPQPYTALVATNYSPHYEGDKVTATGGHCIVPGLHVKHPLADGLDGVFLAMLQTAVNGYGFVPIL